VMELIHRAMFFGLTAGKAYHPKRQVRDLDQCEQR